MIAPMTIRIKIVAAKINHIFCDGLMNKSSAHLFSELPLANTIIEVFGIIGVHMFSARIPSIPETL